VNVDVEIDVADAGLRRTVRTAFVPAAIAGAGVADVDEFQTPPLWQPAAAFPGKLPRQHRFFAAPAGADDVRTQFSILAVIGTDHLPFAEDGVAEQGVGGGGHGDAVADKHSIVWYIGIEIVSRERYALRTHRNKPGHHGRQIGHSWHACSGRVGLAQLGAGLSPEAILADHPRLTHADIQAAQAFAADYLADEDIVYG
jgi:hypothetical protein